MTAPEYQVVVSFRVGPRMRTPMDNWIHDLRDALRLWAEDNSDGIAPGSLDVAIREIGASGESSAIEGAGP
jgi:hypothetical protein